MNIGLYFGTFNPVHIGHLIIANYMAGYTGLERIWMVLTPRNPFKNKETLLEDYHRLALLRIAIENNPKLQACDIEFGLPKPSYTYKTLAYLKDKYPQHQFNLIMGEDNLRTFHKWKNYETIIQNHKLYVYPRLLTTEEQLQNTHWLADYTMKNHPQVVHVDAPIMRISAGFIRQAIKDKKDVRYLLTDQVYKYVTEMHFYEK